MRGGLLRRTGITLCAVSVLGLCNITPASAASAPDDVVGARHRDPAGFEHSLALLDDGTVVAWGSNRMSQLGNGT